MLIDTHAHLNFLIYNKDRKETIKKTLKENVWMINIGTNYQTSKIALDIAKEYKEGIFASVGLHPINLDTGLIKMKRDKNESGEAHFEKEFDFEKYAKLIKNGKNKVVAIGEIGFDYWYRPKSKTKREIFKEKQRELFRKEVALAEKFKLPLILHCRLGYEDLIEELKNINYKYGGVIHCFCGEIKYLKKFLEMGYYIGFNGIIFKKIEGIDFNEIIKKTPLEKILVETDCPFLTPPQISEKSGFKKTKPDFLRNEPVNVKYIAEKIAEIKKTKAKKIEEVTTKNAITLFKLK
jgi:TatD DNase family protein